jgi:hypothetical protein
MKGPLRLSGLTAWSAAASWLAGIAGIIALAVVVELGRGRSDCNEATGVCADYGALRVVVELVFVALLCLVPSAVGYSAILFSRTQSTGSLAIIVGAKTLWVLMCLDALSVGGAILLPSAALAVLTAGSAVVKALKTAV